MGWAWILSLIFAVLGIIGSVISLARGGLGPIVTFVLDVVIIFYLTRPNVKAFFGESKSKT
jgi:phage-related protein